MEQSQLQTPVVMLIFNRPCVTRQVFEAVRKARPEKLLVIADGPRANRQEDYDLCAGARGIFDDVDWPCTVEKNFAEANLGCMRRVSSGLDWAFERVEEAIILEDDCLPAATFFPYCTELLDRYRDDPRIAQISGVNFLFGRHKISYSYYFSRYNQAWGWATWRRAWLCNDNAMELWPAFRSEGGLSKLIKDQRVVQYWTDVLDQVMAANIDSWACRWSLACLRQEMLTLIPSVNLVSNIGFGEDATHTTEDESHLLANVPTEEMVFPLAHPAMVVPDCIADGITERIMFRHPSILTKLFRFLRSCL